MAGRDVTGPTFITSAIVNGPRALVERGGDWRGTAFPVRYGLFRHPRAGLVMIDTGYTEHLWRAPGLELAVYRALLRPQLVADQQPGTVLARLGASPSDIRHVIVTHLHADHVCGLADFPNATFHLSRASAELVRSGGWLRSRRQSLHRQLLPHDLLERAALFEEARPCTAEGLGEGHDIFGDGICLAIDLPGHMAGHAGVAWPRLDRPVLYAVDAAWTSTGLSEAPIPPPPLRFILDDETAVRRSAAKLHAAAAAGWHVVLCHEPEQP